MDENAFARQLSEEGFRETTTVARDAGMLDVHSHPFEAKALVLRGEIMIAIDGAERIYRSGDVFHLPADCPHAETYGPHGVTYLVGRK